MHRIAADFMGRVNKGGTMAILLGILLVLVVGILPMVVYALILWWFDRYEKEPLGLLIAAFLWGAVPAVIFSIIAELVLDIPIAYFVDPVAAGVIGIAIVALEDYKLITVSVAYKKPGGNMLVDDISLIQLP